MIRVAQLGDSHLDEKQDLQDNVRVHEAAIDAIEEAKVDLIVHPGDIHNRLSSPEVREAGLYLVDRLAALAPLLILRGNHDRPKDLRVYAGRRTKHPVHLFEQAGVADFQIGPGLERVQVRLRVLALPWIDKAQAAAQMEGSIGETDDAVQRAITRLLDTMKAWALKPADGMTIGAAHVTIGGSILSTGQTLIGKGLELNAGDLLRTGAGLWLVAHIHARQGFLMDSSDIVETRVGTRATASFAMKPNAKPEDAIDRWRVWYSGSVQRLNYGEPEEKSWTLHVLEHDPEAPGGVGIVSQELHALPARRIERFEWSLEMVREYLEREGPAGPDGIFSADESIAGARLRLRFPIRPDELAALDVDALEAKLLAEGATQVKLEPIIQHAARVRSEEINQVATRWGQLKAWLDTCGIDCPDQVLERRLEEKLAELEGASC